MSTDEMRKEFEEWLEGSGLNYKESIGAWYGWQAALSSRMVLLPDKLDERSGFSSEEITGWNMCQDLCLDLVQDAGIKVELF